MGENFLKNAVSAWGAALEAALASTDLDALKALFCDPAYFRDNGALTWDYRQFHGQEAVVAKLAELAPEFTPHNFRLSDAWPEPQIMGQGEAAVVEAFFDFETRHGRGVLLLNADVPSEAHNGKITAQAIYTRLEALNSVVAAQPHPRGRGYTAQVPGQTWKEHQIASRSYEVSNPEVIVVGAGQAGLTTSAYLRKFGVDVLNIDRHKKVGDSWNKRYDSLYLHNPVEMNAFPFLAFPPHYPEYLPKDLIGEWLDIYARYMDLNVWTGTEFLSARYDNERSRWDVQLRREDGTERTLHPRHIVLATGGIGGKPFVPALRGADAFAGKIMHSSEYGRASDYGIKKAVIIGVATSAHDIARNLQESGVKVTMFQRGAVVVNNIETANLAYAGYLDPTIPTALVDIRYGIGLINPLREKGSRAYHAMAKEIDSELLTRLEQAGLQLGDGVDGQGWLDLFLRTGGGYYLNTGTSELIADGKIKVEQYDRIDQVVANGIQLNNGNVIEADIIVLATGYQSRKSEVVDFFGQDVADRVGEIARLDDEGEWANIWGQTRQQGLWFNGGGINQMRSGSAVLALLVKADLDGFIASEQRRGGISDAAQPAEALSDVTSTVMPAQPVQVPQEFTQA